MRSHTTVGKSHLASRAAFFALLWVGAATALTACSPDGAGSGALLESNNSDVTDDGVVLAQETYQVDYGATTGSVPTVDCTGVPAVCGTGSGTMTMPDGSGELSVTMGCDGGQGLCFALADSTVNVTVDVLQDENFKRAAAGRPVSEANLRELQYTIPSNTTAFPFPEIDVFVGPAGSKTTTDPGVALAAKISQVPAGTTFSEVRHLVVTEGSPGGAVIETNVRNETPFVILVASLNRIDAGAPLPAGQLEIDVQPVLDISFQSSPPASPLATAPRRAHRTNLDSRRI